MAVALVPMMACVWFAVTLVSGSTRPLAVVDLRTGQRLRLWSETPDLAHWDPDVADPALYYEVTRGSEVLVSKHFLTIDSHPDHDIRVAYAADGSLVCVYDVNHWDDGLFVIYDVASGAVWPGASTGADDPEVEQRWSDRFHLLKAANPDLPRPVSSW